MAGAYAGARAGRRAAARRLAALCGLALAASSLAPSRATAEDASDVRTDLPAIASLPVVVAASGPGILLDVSRGDTSRYLVSNDDGATFGAIDHPGLSAGVIAGARDGALVTYVAADGADADTTSVYVHDFASATTAGPIAVPVVEPAAVDARTAVFLDDTGDYQARDLATGEQHPLDFTPRTAAGEVQVQLGGGTTALMTELAFGSTGLPSTGSLDLVPLDGSSAPDRVAVPGLLAAALRDDQVVYAAAPTTATGSQQLCFRSLAQWETADCRLVKVAGLADQRATDMQLLAGPDWVQWAITSAAGTNAYVVGGTVAPGAPIPVDAGPDTTLSWLGDPERPLAAVADEDPGFLGRIESDGTLSPVCRFPDVPAALSVLELTPDRVSGLNSRPDGSAGTMPAWQRDVSDTGLGEPTTPFPRATDLGTSGARTLLDDGTRLRLYDRGGHYMRSLPRSAYGAYPGLISGPFFPANTLSYRQALAVDGTVLKTAALRGMFGSLVLVRTNAKLGRYDVVDLADGSSTRVAVPVQYRVWGFSLAGLWGDWVYGYTIDTDGVPYTLAINYRLQRTYARYGLPVDYGDGFVAVKYAASDAGGTSVSRLEVWNPVTGEAEDIPDTDWDQVVTDGTHRLAYSTGSQLVLRKLSVAPVSAPRLLGVLAPAELNLIVTSAERQPWRLEVDTTKALAEGTLTITDAAGEVVRTFPTPASPDGSLRGLVWDGRLAGGEDAVPGADVPVGDYTWTLRAPAADGSGNVVGVDGASDLGEDQPAGVSGTIHVVREYIGTVAGTTPTISGTPQVDRTLAARPGTWTPSGRSLAYQWLRTTSRGTIPIDGATGAGYTVQPADAGAKLSVAVTGTREGWRTTRKTSRLTATVARATLTRASTPTLSDPTPAVGTTLTATAGAWEPAPVSLTYTWYKVSSSGRSTVVSRAGETYLVAATDRGHRIKVTVTGRRDGYTTTSRTSRLSSAVTRT